MSPTGIAVLGLGQSATGSAVGVEGRSNNSPNGVGVDGEAASTGVLGFATGTSGVGIAGSASDTSGATVGVEGSVNSAAGTAALFNNFQNGNLIVGQLNSINRFVVTGDGNVTTFGVGNITAAGNVSGVGGSFTQVTAVNPNVAGTAIVAHSSDTGSALEFALDATMNGTFGGAVRAITTQSSGVAGTFQNTANGAVLRAQDSGGNNVFQVDATAGTTIGSGGTPILKHLSNTSAVTFPAYSSIQCDDQTVAVSGAASGDSVALGIDTTLAAVSGVQYSAFVSNAGTVTVRRCAFLSAGGSTSGTVRVDVWRH